MQHCARRRTWASPSESGGILTWLTGIIHICIYMYTIITQDTSLENVPTSHAVSLAPFMHVCSDSANIMHLLMQMVSAFICY